VKWRRTVDLVADSTQRTIRGRTSRSGCPLLAQRAVDRGGKGDYQVVPEMIEAPWACVSRDGRSDKQWWLTVRVPDDATAGRYRMKLTLRPTRRPTVVEWRLLSCPFTDATGRQALGHVAESFPPVGGLRGPERRGRNTPAEEARLVAPIWRISRPTLRLAIFNFYFGVKENPDGSFTHDISPLARTWNTGRPGTDTPVAIGCESRSATWSTARWPGRQHVPGTSAQGAPGDRWPGHTSRRGPRRGGPSCYFYPIDEPGTQDRKSDALWPRTC